MKYLIIVIVATLVMYLLFSFAQWQFNPGVWDISTRHGLVTALVVIYICTGLWAILENIE